MNELLTTLYRSVRPAEALKSQDIYESANVLIGKEVEKFAELIIEECAMVVDQAEPHNTWTKRYSTLIKEHFEQN
jgi:hypothetical protein